MDNLPVSQILTILALALLVFGLLHLTNWVNKKWEFGLPFVRLPKPIDEENNKEIHGKHIADGNSWESSKIRTRISVDTRGLYPRLGEERKWRLGGELVPGKAFTIFIGVVCIAIILNFPAISPIWGYLVLLGCTAVAGRYWKDRTVIQSILWLWLAILTILSLLLITQSFWAPWDINSLWYKW
jgi:hypothetical protein